MKTQTSAEPRPPEHRRLLSLRADLLQLISEMQENRTLNAAKWQIESLRNSIHHIEQRLGLSHSPHA